jgi:hypothetical protein
MKREAGSLPEPISSHVRDRSDQLLDGLTRVTYPSMRPSSMHASSSRLTGRPRNTVTRYPSTALRVQRLGAVNMPSAKRAAGVSGSHYGHPLCTSRRPCSSLAPRRASIRNTRTPCGPRCRNRRRRRPRCSGPAGRRQDQTLRRYRPSTSSLGYAPQVLPNCVLPPTDEVSLRLAAHGACRPASLCMSTGRARRA